jgi:hypothetical protein
MTTVTLNIDTLTPEHIKLGRYLLCAAIEGGIDYWATIERVWKCRPVNDRTDWDYIAVRVRELEENGDEPCARKIITAEDMILACVKLLQRPSMKNEYAIKACTTALFNPEDNDHDADVADMLLQMAMFGDLIYG